MKNKPESHPADQAFTSEDAKPWDLPAWNGEGRTVKSALREEQEKARKKAAAQKKAGAAVAPPPKPPTAEELKAIADQAQQEGYADGFKEGMEKGLQQGEQTGLKRGEEKAYQETRARYDSELDRLKSIADRLLAPTCEQDQQLEAVIVDMAVNLARKLIHSELTAQPEKITGVVERALAELPVGAKNIVVQLSPADVALIDEHCPAEHRSWRVEENSNLEPGGCLLKTTESLVDYSVASRLEAYLKEAAEQPLVEDTAAEGAQGEGDDQ